MEHSHLCDSLHFFEDSHRSPTSPMINDDDGSEPLWLKSFLRTTYFVPCPIHYDSTKSECNMFCIDCADDALCSICLDDHKDHRIVQVRRSSYNNVIKASDVSSLIDISWVQTYVINSAKIVFLNARPQLRNPKGVTTTCEICSRGLHDCFRFCSLGCKEGTSIQKHVIKMFGYLSELEILEVEMEEYMQSGFILLSLPKSVTKYVVTYHINKLTLSNVELITSLKSVEDIRKKENPSSTAMVAQFQGKHGQMQGFQKVMADKKKKSQGVVSSSNASALVASKKIDVFHHCKKTGH